MSPRYYYEGATVEKDRTVATRMGKANKRMTGTTTGIPFSRFPCRHAKDRLVEKEEHLSQGFDFTLVEEPLRRADTSLRTVEKEEQLSQVSELALAEKLLRRADTSPRSGHV